MSLRWSPNAAVCSGPIRARPAACAARSPCRRRRPRRRPSGRGPAPRGIPGSPGAGRPAAGRPSGGAEDRDLDRWPGFREHVGHPARPVQEASGLERRVVPGRLQQHRVRAGERDRQVVPLVGEPAHAPDGRSDHRRVEHLGVQDAAPVLEVGAVVADRRHPGEPVTEEVDQGAALPAGGGTQLHPAARQRLGQVPEPRVDRHALAEQRAVEIDREQPQVGELARIGQLGGVEDGRHGHQCPRSRGFGVSHGPGSRG